MTNEEALKMIKFELEYFPNAFSALNGTWEKCVEALEKQIPQKPLDFGDKAYLCPTCRRNNFYDGTETLNKTYFCNYCGQALDWSDKNDRA